ncbi:hypothetical protein JZ751_002586 [Albula glossodonta]|uniref:Uncharacterized protein n=1 Tax=Albula glossodonta TaxID=121402 RepID=A0A8T2N795_9TELE|nr:hypothetical protein JZ751_002586 [Albula glossodonta]
MESQEKGRSERKDTGTFHLFSVGLALLLSPASLASHVLRWPSVVLAVVMEAVSLHGLTAASPPSASKKLTPGQVLRSQTVQLLLMSWVPQAHSQLPNTLQTSCVACRGPVCWVYPLLAVAALLPPLRAASPQKPPDHTHSSVVSEGHAHSAGLQEAIIAGAGWLVLPAGFRTRRYSEGPLQGAFWPGPGLAHASVILSNCIIILSRFGGRGEDILHGVYLSPEILCLLLLLELQFLDVGTNCFQTLLDALAVPVHMVTVQHQLH